MILLLGIRFGYRKGNESVTVRITRWMSFRIKKDIRTDAVIMWKWFVGQPHTQFASKSRRAAVSMNSLWSVVAKRPTGIMGGRERYPNSKTMHQTKHQNWMVMVTGKVKRDKKKSNRNKTIVCVWPTFNVHTKLFQMENFPPKKPQCLLSFPTNRVLTCFFGTLFLSPNVNEILTGAWKNKLHESNRRFVLKWNGSWISMNWKCTFSAMISWCFYKIWCLLFSITWFKMRWDTC